MLSQQPIIPDTDLIHKDLAFITRRWDELGTPVFLEIRAFKEDYKPQIRKFSPATA